MQIRARTPFLFHCSNPNTIMSQSASPSTNRDDVAARGELVNVVALDCSKHPLSKKEIDQLEQCERVLSYGLKHFFDVGNALLIIRDQRLYRGTHGTFEAYCHERWVLGRSYAWRLIAA